MSCEQHASEPPLPSLTEPELITLLEQYGLWTPPHQASNALPAVNPIQNALAQARRSHANQRRDNGRPYLEEHIYPATAEVVYAYESDRGMPAPINAIVATILHDAIEDDPDFTEECCRVLFGAEVTRIVSLVTKAPQDNATNLPEAQKQRINQRKLARIVQSPHDSEKYVNLADRTMNLQSTPSIRLTNPLKFGRYITETRAIYLPFAETFSPYFYHRLSTLIAQLSAIG